MGDIAKKCGGICTWKIPDFRMGDFEYSPIISQKIDKVVHFFVTPRVKQAPQGELQRFFCPIIGTF